MRLSAIVAGVLIATLALGCQTSDSAASLKVGDCLNHTAGVDANGDPVQQIAVLDCGQPHENEVFSVFVYPNASAAFPGYEQIGSVEQTKCQADFVTYVGVEWERSSYTISYSAPTESSWGQGDHSIRCLLEDASGGTLTGSARGTRR